MNATMRNILLAVLPVATLGSGCLHHHATQAETSGVLACAPAPGESACYESSRFDDNGTLRHHVVERTTPGDSCDLVNIEQTAFDASGTLVERIVEDRRCRVVERTISTRYDLDAGVVEHRVRRDEDHDAELDFDTTTRVAMTERVRSLALATGRTRSARLAASIAAQRSGRLPITHPPMLVSTGG
jgi:hypothetical protein